MSAHKYVQESISKIIIYNLLIIGGVLILMTCLIEEKFDLSCLVDEDFLFFIQVLLIVVFFQIFNRIQIEYNDNKFRYKKGFASNYSRWYAYNEVFVCLDYSYRTDIKINENTVIRIVKYYAKKDDINNLLRLMNADMFR